MNKIIKNFSIKLSISPNFYFIEILLDIFLQMAKNF